MNAPVLIVDDSLTVRMDLSEAFQAAGFRTVVCATAGEARGAVAREPVALVILDVILPDADGVELLGELRGAAATRDIPVLLLSTETEVRDRLRGLRVGADEYIGKPYDRGYVVARARELLGRDQRKSPAVVTILVIDDSATYREELREALTSAGYLVLLAETGEEGLRVAANSRPTAIVVDGILPDLSGVAVIRRIRLDAVLRGVPCLLLTASEQKDVELQALDAGADAFVRKDEETGVVLARLAALLRGSSKEQDDPGIASLLGPKRILAVDDSATYLQELASMLREEGYDVVLAHSGEEALDLLAFQPVDCILLDLLMPGIGGNETCRRIKAAPTMRHAPLIMLTAVEDRDAMIESLGAGADDYVPKSSDFEVLKARLRSQIRRRQAEEEHRQLRERLLRSELDAVEARAARELAETRAALVEELKLKNAELEAFSYSVSHDLRAPLRGIDGFSQALLEDYSEKLDATGRGYLKRVRAAAQRMGMLIDDMLELSRVGRSALVRERTDLSALARSVAWELGEADPARQVTFVIPEGLTADVDPHLLRIALQNLLGNAWKFTAKTTNPIIEVGALGAADHMTYFVRDNGVGFDMAHAKKLFAPFQRLHSEKEFPGTGIGLATVQRIVHRHGGTVRAEGETGRGATISFTI